MSDRDGLVDLLCIQDLDDIFRQERRPVCLRLCRLGRAAVPQHIRDDQPIALIAEERDLVPPVKGAAGEPVQEEESGFVALGSGDVVVVD